MEKELIPLSEYAKLRGITQKAAYYRYKNGKISAKKIGRNIFYVQESITDQEKKIIGSAVARTVNEYGETLKRLGDE